MSSSRVATLFSRPLLTGLSLAAALALTACSTSTPSATADSSATAQRSSHGVLSVARLEATKGSKVSGVVQFFPLVEGGVRVQGRVEGLAPNSEHGFHIHEKGDCSSGDGMSTGGHFNPTAKAHGAHDHSEHHAGDLASLKADANGVARFSYTTTALSVGMGATDVVGRGLIVHRDPDDFKTQPTGNSGPRQACGVINRS